MNNKQNTNETLSHMKSLIGLRKNIPQDFYNKHKKECEYYGRGGVEVDLRELYESEINSLRVYG